MSRRGKFVVGGLVIVAAIAYLIWAGVSQSVVYFVTPSELLAAPVATKTYRLGGLVLPGSLKWEPQSLDLSFTLSDGKGQRLREAQGRAAGSLRGRARGGRRRGVDAGGLLQGLPHLAKHSEEYKAPHDGAEPGYKELIKSLRKESTR
jgi:cytochrome c-type biogenesis protein CcmE